MTYLSGSQATEQLELKLLLCGIPGSNCVCMPADKASTVLTTHMLLHQLIQDTDEATDQQVSLHH